MRLWELCDKIKHEPPNSEVLIELHTPNNVNSRETYNTHEVDIRWNDLTQKHAIVIVGHKSK